MLPDAAGTWSASAVPLAKPEFASQSIITFHPHFLVSPLVAALSYFEDEHEPFASQLIHLILTLSASADPSVCREFVARVSDRISSGALGWSSRQLHTAADYIRHTGTAPSSKPDQSKGDDDAATAQSIGGGGGGLGGLGKFAGGFFK